MISSSVVSAEGPPFPTAPPDETGAHRRKPPSAEDHQQDEHHQQHVIVATTTPDVAPTAFFDQARLSLQDRELTHCLLIEALAHNARLWRVASAGASVGQKTFSAKAVIDGVTNFLKSGGTGTIGAGGKGDVGRSEEQDLICGPDKHVMYSAGTRNSSWARVSVSLGGRGAVSCQ